jgi:thiosulfate/3-mercaptopyruvate sulfurtransferase
MPVFYLNMKYETTVDPVNAHDHLQDASWAFVDCRCFLKEPDRGEREYRESHVKGAVYAHLDRDLSGPVVHGRTGRHPLPSPDALAGTFRRLGISAATQVVAYDESNGSMAAARLWWLLKWAGHDAVAVLDGGLAKWRSLGMPCTSGSERRPEAEFVGAFRPELVLPAEGVLSVLDDPGFVVFDSRTADRYQGLHETIDPVAGHIPGALSAPYLDNVRDDGSFKPAGELARRFRGLMGGRDAVHAIFYCGSGVTAAHNILACAHAGMGMARLYPGSWSEWITDPRRPVATGPS